MLLYYITDRRQFAGDTTAQRHALLAKIAEAARCGVDYIQLREKDLATRELQRLTYEAVRIVRDVRNQSKVEHGNRKLETRKSKLLINARTDVALAAGADGVHLPSGDLAPSEVRAIWDATLRSRELRIEDGEAELATGDWRPATIAVSCHSVADVLAAESHGADFAVFAPVFEKEGRAGVGLDALRDACCRATARDAKTEAAATGQMPVLALGGVTLANVRACVEAGATGIAGIRLFQENDIAEIVRKLR